MARDLWRDGHHGGAGGVRVDGRASVAIVQGFAGGVLGPRTYSGGAATALLGLLLHFLIAFGAATVFFVASRGLQFLVEHAVLSGVLYGIAVYFFMNRVVVPLSAAAKYPFSVKMMVIGVVIHIFCVGLPISLNVRRYGR